MDFLQELAATKMKKTTNTLSNSNYIVHFLAKTSFYEKLFEICTYGFVLHVYAVYCTNVTDTKAINNQQIIEISKKRFGKPHILKYYPTPYHYRIIGA
jgi:hypothetical protein